MDQFSTITLMIIAFLAWNQQIPWLFLLMMIVLVLSSKSIGLASLFIAGAIITYFVNVKEVWIGIVVLLVIFVLIAKRKEEDAAGMYSPELMRLLGG